VRQNFENRSTFVDDMDKKFAAYFLGHHVCNPLDAHCCLMGTATKHPVPDRVKLSFVIFDIRAL